MNCTEQVLGINVAWALGRWMSFYGEEVIAGNKFWMEYLNNNAHTQANYFVNRDCYMMTPKAASKIEALCGPHWFAILKAYEARK